MCHSNQSHIPTDTYLIRFTLGGWSVHFFKKLLKMIIRCLIVVCLKSSKQRDDVFPEASPSPAARLHKDNVLSVRPLWKMIIIIFI